MRLCADSEFESPDAFNAYYVPRDESFNPIKMRDQGGDAARATKHAQNAAGAIPVRGSSFDTIESIKRAYAPEGVTRGPLYPLPQVLQGMPSLLPSLVSCIPVYAWKGLGLREAIWGTVACCRDKHFNAHHRVADCLLGHVVFGCYPSHR